MNNVTRFFFGPAFGEILALWASLVETNEEQMVEMNAAVAAFIEDPDGGFGTLCSVVGKITEQRYWEDHGHLNVSARRFQAVKCDGSSIPLGGEFHLSWDEHWSEDGNSIEIRFFQDRYGKVEVSVEAPPGTFEWMENRRIAA